MAEILFDQGFQYETGITLDGGRTCAITLKLDEPIQIPGDDSIILPFGCLSWAHDGSASLKVRAGTIRQVCANTVSASEAEGKRLGTDFTFRHTKNVHGAHRGRQEGCSRRPRGSQGLRGGHEELATIKVSPDQRDLFVSTIIGDAVKQYGEIRFRSLDPDTSARVKTNIENDRVKILNTFMGETIPEAHRLTGYGLFQAGVEYFDHLRAFRTPESYVKRTLLNHSGEKSALGRTIREIVAA